jgi:hypothetical protein
MPSEPSSITREQFEAAVLEMRSPKTIRAYADQQGKTIDAMAHWIAMDHPDCKFCPKFDVCKDKPWMDDDCPGSPTQQNVKDFFAKEANGD